MAKPGTKKAFDELVTKIIKSGKSEKKKDKSKDVGIDKKRQKR